MNRRILQIAVLLDMLPEREQNKALELLKRIIIAWDGDYTKLTPKESAELSEAENSGYIDERAIDWNRLETYINRR